MEGVTGRRSRWDVRIRSTTLSPEYVAEFIRDENRVAVRCKAQRSRPFWEIPSISCEG